MYHLKRFWLDLRMGKCSGFPNCCIAWYVTGWKMIFGSKDSMVQKSRWRRNLISMYSRAACEAQYVPCPFCLISKARVSIRLCDSKCGHRNESLALLRQRYPDEDWDI